MQNARYWLLTIPRNDYSLPSELAELQSYIRGQLEQGASGFEHWQVQINSHRSWSATLDQSDWPSSSGNSAIPRTPSPVDQRQPETMFGKNQPAWAPVSNLDNIQCEETTKPIGPEYGKRPSLEILRQYQTTYVFHIIALSEQSALTTRNLLRQSEWLCVSGAQLRLESQEEPGSWADWKLTAKIPAPSFGAGTKVKNLLLSMNFVVASTSVTSCDGWIDILCTLRPKEPANLWQQPNSYSPPICPPQNGTQPSIKLPMKHLLDD